MSKEKFEANVEALKAYDKAFTEAFGVKSMEDRLEQAKLLRKAVEASCVQVNAVDGVGPARVYADACWQAYYDSL